MDYHVVSQGKTTIPGVADDEEFKDTDVSWEKFLWPLWCPFFKQKIGEFHFINGTLRI